MIWVFLTCRGLGPIAFVKDYIQQGSRGLNWAGYHRILHEVFLPYRAEHDEFGDMIFQHDNAPCHSPKKVSSFCSQL